MSDANPPRKLSKADAEEIIRLANIIYFRSPVLVILDSDYKAAYKLPELRAYAGFVSPDSYLIAEDSTFDYFPAWPEYGPGPATAVREFMKE